MIYRKKVIKYLQGKKIVDEILKTSYRIKPKWRGNGLVSNSLHTIQDFKGMITCTSRAKLKLPQFLKYPIKASCRNLKKRGILSIKLSPSSHLQIFEDECKTSNRVSNLSDKSKRSDSFWCQDWPTNYFSLWTLEKKVERRINLPLPPFKFCILFEIF